MLDDPDLPNVGRQTPAQGVMPTLDGATILWCTVCADQRGTWCTQDSVYALLHEVWADAHNRWLVGDFLLMPDHVHFFATPKDGPWVEVERWTAFWKDQFSKRTPNASWRWQRRIFHHRLRSEREYLDKVTYMRQNPVRAGLVHAPESWEWQGRIHEVRW
jgi:REP element-mobilizing transposase RayT